MKQRPTGETRRTFIRQTALTMSALATAPAAVLSASGGREVADAGQPWYRRTLRWGQTNITEVDPTRYDIDWWRTQWKRTATQGVIVNAGGIVAYYPSRVPLHRPAARLGGRDLFGELCRAAHDAGIVVLARMDSNRAHEDLYRAHPDWFAVDAAGRPHMAGELYVSCVNGPYYDQHIPAILTEIAELYHPEGFTDNSWSGLGRGTICYCVNCRRKFRERTGKDIPATKDWNDPGYREWIRWNYDRRLEIWDLNDRTTRAAGGPHCIWAGMNSGSVSAQSQSFRDVKAICERAAIVMLDHQSRSDAAGFQNNGEAGKLIHGLLGWEKLVPESMAMYQAGRPTFRLSAKPPAEARMWMLDGIAGGLQPWWHHVGAYHEDRRMYRTAEPVCRWHQEHAAVLVERQPVATIGVVWSQQNVDFFGRDDADLLVDLPWRGITQSLIRARIPYLPVHADHVDRDASSFSALILPNLGAMSDPQVASIRRFVAGGGGLLATGHTSLFDQWGDPRRDFALADIFGAHVSDAWRAGGEAARKSQAGDTSHTYLRILPELRAGMDGPHVGGEPSVSGVRHRVLRGFEETDLLPFGGVLESLQVSPGAEVLLTFVPPFPIYPPETAWMRQPKTDIPGLILNVVDNARVAFLPADIDRRFARDNLPDHGDLLASLVRWVARENVPIAVEGSGLIDCHVYHQPGRLILHIVNLTSAGSWRAPVHELIRVGPLRFSVKLPQDVRGAVVRLLVGGTATSGRTEAGWSRFEVKEVLDHEVVLVE